MNVCFFLCFSWNAHETTVKKNIAIASCIKRLTIVNLYVITNIWSHEVLNAIKIKVYNKSVKKVCFFLHYFTEKNRRNKCRFTIQCVYIVRITDQNHCYQSNEQCSFGFFFFVNGSFERSHRISSQMIYFSEFTLNELNHSTNRLIFVAAGNSTLTFLNETYC